MRKKTKITREELYAMVDRYSENRDFPGNDLDLVFELLEALGYLNFNEEKPKMKQLQMVSNGKN